MTNDRRRKVIAAAIVADVLIFGGWIASLQAGLAHDAVKLPVEGYDPRDLLSGHYVRFRLTAEREAAPLVPREQAGRVSFCAEESGGFVHPTHVRAPGEPCRLVMTGDVEGERVRFGAERFYVDERRANEVGFVRAGPQTYLVATLDGSGAVHPVDLVVEGKSLRRR